MDSTIDIGERQQFCDDNISKIIDGAYCTDYVTLSESQEKDLSQIWIDIVGNPEELKGGKLCPADIFYADTIPLKDLTIEIDNNNNMQYRIILFENFIDFMPLLDYYDSFPVGLFEMYAKDLGLKIYFTIMITSELRNYVAPCFVGSPTNKIVTQGILNNEEEYRRSLALCNSVLGLWYSIQICLLNPKTETIFANPTKSKLKGKEKIEAQKVDKTVKYIKHYYVKDEDIDNVLFGGDRSYNRKCLVWYVTGHWRELKNGKRTFVHGYFKGALRNTPTSDVARKRELVINESEEN